jgi:hypothetical protein
MEKADITIAWMTRVVVLIRMNRLGIATNAEGLVDGCVVRCATTTIGHLAVPRFTVLSRTNYMRVC